MAEGGNPVGSVLTPLDCSCCFAARRSGSSCCRCKNRSTINDAQTSLKQLPANRCSWLVDWIGPEKVGPECQCQSVGGRVRLPLRRCNHSEPELRKRSGSSSRYQTEGRVCTDRQKPP